jgi:hypothetical protein
MWCCLAGSVLNQVVDSVSRPMEGQAAAAARSSHQHHQQQQGTAQMNHKHKQ